MFFSARLSYLRVSRSSSRLHLRSTIPPQSDACQRAAYSSSPANSPRDRRRTKIYKLTSSCVRSKNFCFQAAVSNPLSCVASKSRPDFKLFPKSTLRPRSTYTASATYVLSNTPYSEPNTSSGTMKSRFKHHVFLCMTPLFPHVQQARPEQAPEPSFLIPQPVQFCDSRCSPLNALFSWSALC